MLPFLTIFLFGVHVQAEVDKGVDPSRIFLVGFGQGGATVSDASPSIQHPTLFINGNSILFDSFHRLSHHRMHLVWFDVFILT
jgi:hypothetical protein